MAFVTPKRRPLPSTHKKDHYRANKIRGLSPGRAIAEIKLEMATGKKAGPMNP